MDIKRIITNNVIYFQTQSKHPGKVGKREFMGYNEEDTKLHLITPILQHAGWIGSRITMEYSISPGQIIIAGEGHKQARPEKADYLLRFTESLPIAVVEAKDENHNVGDGLQQAMKYAEKLGVLFAYSTNGHGLVEWDFTTMSKRDLLMVDMPTPDSLWDKTCKHRALSARSHTNPLLHPYWQDPYGKKNIRYYQEVAVNRTIEAILKGQQKILLNLATGTGKTFIAFQTVWKLIKSDFFANKRVLFIADRIVLRNQAFNTFEPFKEGTGDPRAEIDNDQGLPKGKQIFFAIYQELYANSSLGLRRYEYFSQDYFDLIIIDECHRSGFGTWKEILNYFPHAIQLGMTATPKRSDNIDTYKHFGEPIFFYSLGQGIDDGFLANYKIHKARTDLDIGGLDIARALNDGGRIEIPEGGTVRPHYTPGDFERDITIPDRIELHCKHLTTLLRTYGRMEKTIIFCVSQDHALQVRDHLNSLNKDLNISNYAVRIVSEESNAQALLEKFQAVDKPTPVIATTVDLLSTGVDAPSVRNIVFFKTVSSPTVFKQIIGRGSRLCEDTGKYWFRIIDYTNATALFDEWDQPSPPESDETKPVSQQLCWLGGKVLSKNDQPVVNALVTIQIGPNEIMQQRTGSDGQFLFLDLPSGKIHIEVSANKFQTTNKVISLTEKILNLINIHLRAAAEHKDKMIRVSGVTVTIIDEKYEERDAEGNLVTPQDYLKKVRKEVVQVCSSLLDLRKQWSNPDRRKELLRALEERQVALDVLAEILKRPDVDSYDILAHLAFEESMYSREERATALFNLHRQFFDMYPEQARRILTIMVDRYIQGGLEEILDPEVFKLPPIRQEVGQVAAVFGGMHQFLQARDNLMVHLYQ